MVPVGEPQEAGEMRGSNARRAASVLSYGGNSHASPLIVREGVTYGIDENVFAGLNKRARIEVEPVNDGDPNAVDYGCHDEP